MQQIQPLYLVLPVFVVVLGLGVTALWLAWRLSRSREAVAQLRSERGQALEAAERAEHLAYHDALTGLANRKLFLDRLTIELARARRKNEHLAVMFMDIDRFKLVNDSLGHAVGDRLLRVTGDRISSCIRATDTLARLGGDEFALLFPACAGEGAGIIAEKILTALREPVRLDDRDLHATGSIGIAVYPEDGVDLDGIMQSADAAMYQAKQVGRNTSRFFRAAMNMRAATRLSVETALRRAIARNEFRLHFQPVVDCGSGVVRRAEALLRWDHPDRGLLSPGQFLAAAEASGLIVDIGRWTLVSALGTARRWRERGWNVAVAVNLAPRHFSEPKLVATIERMLIEAGVPGAALELEITESTALGNIDRAAEVMGHLRVLGTRISLDDFGAGYSAMNHLSRLPIDVLKLDQSFVRGAPVNRMDAAIVQAMTHLAHTMGAEVVAEGVETAEQLAFARDCGVDLAQGYLIASPSAEADLDLDDVGRTARRRPPGARTAVLDRPRLDAPPSR